MRTEGRVVLVTGGAGGIGLALVDRFLAGGCSVVICGRSVGPLAAAQVRFPAVETVRADVSTAAGRAAVRQHLEQHHGRLGILINNAAIHVVHDFTDPVHTAPEIEDEIATNLVAPIRLGMELMPLLRAEADAAIVNISSTLAIVPKRTAPLYCATKAALHAFTTALRGQFEGTPIRVFSVITPQVETPMTAGRGRRKMTAERFAELLVQGLAADVLEMRPGASARLMRLHAHNPRAAELLVRRMTEPLPPERNAP